MIRTQESNTVGCDVGQVKVELVDVTSSSSRCRFLEIVQEFDVQVDVVVFVLRSVVDDFDPGSLLLLEDVRVLDLSRKQLMKVFFSSFSIIARMLNMFSLSDMSFLSF